MTKVLHSLYNIDTFDSIGPVEVTRQDILLAAVAITTVIAFAVATWPW